MTGRRAHSEAISIWLGNIEGHFDRSEQPVPGPERFQDGNQFFRCLHGAFRNLDSQGPAARWAARAAEAAAVSPFA